MNEIKASDGETNNSFNEDFDFGETETTVHTTKTNTAAQINKKLLLLSVVIALSIVGVIGYRFYKTHRNEINKTNPIAPPAAPLSATKTPLSHTVPSAIVPATTPAISAVTPPGTSEPHFQGIAEAFNEADHSTPSPHASSTPSVEKEGNIQNLQKELFTTENSSKNATNDGTSAPSASTAVSRTTPLEEKTMALADGLNKLTQQMSDIFEQIRYLDSYTRDVSDNLNKLNESISALDRRLSALTNTTSTLSKDVGNVRNDVGHFKKVLKSDGLDINTDGAPANDSEPKKEGTSGENVTIEEPEYRVHAVIPGRAWLKSSKGQIVTVTEGDAIGNYGKILVIDAANGVVLTSSGLAFR